MLVIGGGDGGTARECLRHGVQQLDMVEIDGRVVELSQQYLPSLGGGAGGSPLSLTVAMASAAAAADASYDVVLVDGPIHGPAARSASGPRFLNTAAASCDPVACRHQSESPEAFRQVHIDTVKLPGRSGHADPPRLGADVSQRLVELDLRRHRRPRYRQPKPERAASVSANCEIGVSPATGGRCGASGHRTRLGGLAMTTVPDTLFNRDGAIFGRTPRSGRLPGGRSGCPTTAPPSARHPLRAGGHPRRERWAGDLRPPARGHLEAIAFADRRRGISFGAPEPVVAAVQQATEVVLHWGSNP